MSSVERSRRILRKRERRNLRDAMRAEYDACFENHNRMEWQVLEGPCMGELEPYAVGADKRLPIKVSGMFNLLVEEVSGFECGYFGYTNTEIIVMLHDGWTLV